MHEDVPALRRLVGLDGINGQAGGHDSQVVPVVLVGQVRGVEVPIRTPQNGFQRPAQRFAELPVGESEPALDILAYDVLGKAFNQRRVEGLGRT